MHNLGFYLTKKVYSKNNNQEMVWQFKLDEFFRRKVFNNFADSGFLDLQNSYFSIGGGWSGILSKIQKLPILKDETYYKPRFILEMEKKNNKFPDWKETWQNMNEDEKSEYRKKYIEKWIGYRDASRQFGYFDDVKIINQSLFDGIKPFLEKSTEKPKIWVQDLGEIKLEELNQKYLNYIAVVIDYHN